MLSPAAAIAWEFRRRHRWGLAAVVLYFALLATIRFLVLGLGQRITFEEDWQFALVVIVPLASTFTFFLAVFSFGLAGDLGARQSIYPARMFTLPLTNAALAGWPMLYGALAMAALWLITRSLAVWPADAHVPWIWPALFAAVFLAWTQVLMWMPYALAGLRVVASVLWLTVIAFVVLLALYLEASEPVMLALLAPHLPRAYLVACFAVARARCGGSPDGQGRLALSEGPRETEPSLIGRIGFRRIGNVLQRRPVPWLSPMDAQAWFEGRRYGRSLPALVGIVLPFEISLLFAFRESPEIIFATLAAVLLTPVLMAVFVASTVSKASPKGSDAYELPQFLAIRPLTSVALITAKIKATIRSTLASWLLILLAIPIALSLSGTWPVLVDGARDLADFAGTPRAVVLGVLGLSALVASTWKQLVQGLYIGLSGRPWLVKASVFVTLAVLTLLVTLVPWALERGAVMGALWKALPFILAVLVCCKIFAAAWIAVSLYDSQLLRNRTLVMGALSWCVAVLSLYSLLLWLLPTILFHRHLLALVAILAIPLARLAAAPLALAKNRHR